MAIYVPQHRRPIITIDHGQGPRSYYGDLDQSTVHSDGSILFCNLALTPLSRNLLKEEAPVTDSSPTITSVDEANKHTALKLVAGRARKVERQRLENAQQIQEAQWQATANLHSVNHDFNNVVLGAVHEGLSYDEITEYLQAQKLEGFEDSVSYAVDGDFDMLYPAAE